MNIISSVNFNHYCQIFPNIELNYKTSAPRHLNLNIESFRNSYENKKTRCTRDIGQKDYDNLLSSEITLSIVNLFFDSKWQ